jgi:hypothetical protein
VADVTYFIGSQRLEGIVAGVKFAFPAWSGGGRGATDPIVPEFSLASFSPYRRMDQEVGIRGGAIPPGLWRIEVPVEAGDSKGPWVSRLIPDSSTREMYPQRDFDVAPFKVHGNGPQGSDGCIVILPGHRIPFLTAVKDAGGASLLVVWEGERLNEQLELRTRFA